MIKHLKGIVLITVLYSLMLIFKDQMPWEVHSRFLSIIVFFLIQSILISALLVYAQQWRDHYAFIALGAVVLRLISAMMFMGWVYFDGLDNPILFVTQLMMVYLSFLAFELSMVLTNLRQN